MMYLLSRACCIPWMRGSGLSMSFCLASFKGLGACTSTALER